jgi:hypothetical protein
MDRSQTSFSVSNSGDDVVLEDPGNDGKMKNILNFKGTGSKA